MFLIFNEKAGVLPQVKGTFSVKMQGLMCCVENESECFVAFKSPHCCSAMGNITAKEKRLQAISRKINYHSAACTAGVW